MKNSFLSVLVLCLLTLSTYAQPSSGPYPTPVTAQTIAQAGGATNDVTIQSFIGNVSSQTAIQRVNAMAAILNPVYGTNWDAILFGNQFNPSAGKSLRGRSWTSGASVGSGTPLYGDPNYAWFNNSGIELNGLNLQNYTIVITFNANPVSYVGIDGSWLGFDTDRTSFNGLLFDAMNTNDNSGVAISAMEIAGCGIGVFPRGTGVGTNNWYDAGVTTYPWQTTTTNFVKFVNCNGAYTFGPFEDRNAVAFQGNLSGQYKCWLNDLPGYFNNNTSNGFSATGSTFGTTAITTLRIGGDTNWLNPSIFHAGGANLTNGYGKFRIQSVFIIPTNTQQAVDLAYTAAFYADSRNKIYVHFGNSLEDETIIVGGSFSFSTNSFIYQIANQNPDWIVENAATSGATIQGMLTNSVSNTNSLAPQILNLPKDFQRVLGIDPRNSLVQPGTSVSQLVCDSWIRQLESSCGTVSNNIAVWGWVAPLAQTNQGTSWSVSQGLSLVNAWKTWQTNGVFSRVIPWGRHITDGSYVASSTDALHFTGNGIVYTEAAKEFNPCGPVLIQFPQTYAPGSTGWTNWTQQTWTLTGTAATALQLFDANGGLINASPATTTSFFSADIPPGGWFTNSSITAQVRTRQWQ